MYQTVASAAVLEFMMLTSVITKSAIILQNRWICKKYFPLKYYLPSKKAFYCYKNLNFFWEKWWDEAVDHEMGFTFNVSSTAFCHLHNTTLDLYYLQHLQTWRPHTYSFSTFFSSLATHTLLYTCSPDMHIMGKVSFDGKKLKSNW